MMLRFIIVSVFSLLIGFAAGVSMSYVYFRDKSPCTCAPCYPTRFCRKCGHISLKCPRLQWYFTSTNFLNRVKK